jgi:dTDP-4-dehydrorhamnose 3,5-epimerase-like enzyme
MVGNGNVQRLLGENMQLKDQYKIIEFVDLGDERGNLVVIEGEGMDIPFDIKRVFYIYGSDSDVVRGQHANRETEFLLVNVGGISKVKIDNGQESKVIELNKPRMGLYLSAMLWKDMYDFSEDSVLLVLASRHYDANEYIRDYEEYLTEVKAGD